MDNIEITNLKPKFLKFYKEANKESFDKDKRWELWKTHYNFAALPPVKNYDQLARDLMENAWDKYRKHISIIEEWEPDINKVQLIVSKIKETLGVFDSININIFYFVGAFEGNSFVAPYKPNQMALFLPIEINDIDIVLAHELTHIIHHKKANISGGWERTIASTILQEGLAMQVSKVIIPNHADTAYTEYQPNWLSSCLKNKKEIIKGIIPFLDEYSTNTVEKFTLGKGTTGHHREAYFVGWILVEYLINCGISFKEISSVQEQDIPAFVKPVLEKMLSN